VLTEREHRLRLHTMAEQQFLGTPAPCALEEERTIALEKRLPTYSGLERISFLQPPLCGIVHGFTSFNKFGAVADQLFPKWSV